MLSTLRNFDYKGGMITVTASKPSDVPAELQAILQEIETDEFNFWADTFHDFCKQIGGIWYDDTESTHLFLEAYIESPVKALHALSMDPETFGRLARPMLKRDREQLVAYLVQKQGWPTLDDVAERMKHYAQLHKRLDELRVSHPELVAAGEAAHKASVKSRSAEQLKGMRICFVTGT